MKYTDRDIEEAKAFVRKRVEAEISMQNHLDEALLWAAKEIVAIAYRYRIRASLFRFSTNKALQKEVDGVLARLREMLYEYTETLSVAADDEEEDSIIAFINRKTYGHTLRERISTYTNHYKYELEAFIAAGLAFGYGADKLTATIRGSVTAPYGNPLFTNAVIKGGMAATRIKTGGVSYGKGHANSARNQLLKLTRYTVGSAWMEVYGGNAYRNGATGFYAFRGSSYPCRTCQEQVGYHPIHEYTGEWHLNCRCYFVFVYN